ncbi:MAG: glutamate 5-kinase [Spirochaetales bacterium]|uniref:Glutamate 5-kinase n=1 Tax=Candidatus Thalassospirochaeta sargassi TaxID=3119039 RepID=A0AAJ1ID08_9SPIO|nr:glutamate 5-kinase [Spirochaetales bacterium]
MKLLVKIGSALISRDNRIDYSWLERKVDELAALYREGVRPVIVSSGAVAAGMEIRSMRKRPTDPVSLQMLSGMGQVRLSKYYKDLFKEKYIFTAQLLLTHHNFDQNSEVSAVTDIINRCLDEGVIPIINENDMINKEEFDSEGNFTDNDILAAFVASSARVDKALILTNVDGLYAGNPHSADKSKVPELISRVDRIDDKIKAMAADGKSDLGLGGMRSKVLAAEMITKAGIETVVANGNYSIIDILENKVPSTIFSVV